MADEIVISITATLNNAGFSDNFVVSRLAIDQAALGANSTIYDISTGEDTIAFTDITTEGYLFLQNLDDTNFVTYGPDSTGMVALGKLKPGESQMLRLSPGTTLIMQADTAVCQVDIKLWED